MAYGQLRTRSEAMADLIPLFKRQLSFCNLKPAERVAVITDTAFNPLYAAAAVAAALDLGAEAFEVVLPHRRSPSEPVLSKIFESSDLIVYSTTHTLHYSPAMAAALASGKRALMAVIPLHILERRIVEPDIIHRTKLGAAHLGAAHTVRITSPAGTDLTLEKTGRPGVASYGVADEPGHLDFWGAGFFQSSIVEGTADGVLVLNTGDLVFHLGLYVDRPVRLEFKKGRLVTVEGGVEAFLIRSLLESYKDPKAFNVGHIACGTDPRALWVAEAVQFPVIGGGGVDAEAFYGNVQVEIGSNDDVVLRGRNRTRAHLGLCCLGCTLTLDGKPFLQDGEFVLEEMKRRRT